MVKPLPTYGLKDADGLAMTLRGEKLGVYVAIKQPVDPHDEQQLSTRASVSGFR